MKRLGDVLPELWKSLPGRIGLLLLGFLLLVTIYVLLAFPMNFGPSRWSNPALWGDYPKTAPPAWTRGFGGNKPLHQILQTSTARTQGRQKIYSIPLAFQASQPPSFLSLSFSDVQYQANPPTIEAVLIRPDGGEVRLYQTVIAGPQPGETPPYRRHQQEPLRIQLDTEPGAVEATYSYLSQRYDPNLSFDEVQRQLPYALFSKVQDGGFVVEKGAYRLEARVRVDNPKDAVGRVRFVVGGAVYGAMGTDSQGRDLAQGLLFGLPIALAIGLSVSTLSTLVGTALGLISGYAGGRTDLLIQRAADVVNNVPTLPLLIFMVFVLGAKLWLILLMLILFSWPGLTILVRSMVLGLRSSLEVEAARALGASPRRIITYHLFPHIAPFIFASLIFAAPGAILAEAGLSFIGLGDPTLPTWGQILEQGFRTGAVFNGYWWWIIPPGLLIVISAIAFMLISLGLEPIVNPRLRRES